MDIHEVFNDSYARCNQHPQFFNLFYELFGQSDDKIRLMFAQSDIAKQTRILKGSIPIMLLASTSEAARNAIRDLGKRHGRNGLGVKKEHYDIWFACLLEAVRRCDPNYNQSIEQAWRECFAAGISIMKEEC